MPITEDEFRALLVERSDTLVAAPDHLARVHRRIVRRQRHVRAGVAVAGVAAVATLAAVGLPALSDSHPTRVVDHPKPALPEYAYGGRLLAGAVLHSPRQGSVTVRFTPTSWRLTVRTTSDADWHGRSSYVAAVNGHPLVWAGGPSVGGLSGNAGEEERFWSSHGVRLGHPSTVTLTITRGKPPRRPVRPVPEPARDRPAGTLTVGVYQRVPVAEYPLPAPPAKLPALPPVSSHRESLDSRQVGATGRWHLTVPVVHGVHLEIKVVAPGQLRMLVEGHLIGDYEWWQYGEMGAGLDVGLRSLRERGVVVEEGGTVDVTVEASRFTVPAWTVQVAPVLP
jgi:hypothetical protein